MSINQEKKTMVNKRFQQIKFYKKNQAFNKNISHKNNIIVHKHQFTQSPNKMK